MKSTFASISLGSRRLLNCCNLATAFTIGGLTAVLSSESPLGRPPGTSTANGFELSNAIVPVAEIRSGGVWRDGIPAIDRPKFTIARQANFLEPGDLVVSVTLEGEARAYPLRLLVWHEIVNDQIGDRSIAVTYCPLCGTAMVFDRDVGGRCVTFGVSGLVYQSDVLLYDRQTASLWSQLAMKSVAGPLAKTELSWLTSEHLTWAAWRQKYPDGRVLSTETGHRRDYRRHPYPGYEQREEALFPIPKYRHELRNKEWVVGVLVDGVAQAYPIRTLPGNQTVQDRVNNAALEITYDLDSQLVVVSKVASGETLPYVKVYWFAWQAFYPKTGLWRAQ